MMAKIIDGSLCYHFSIKEFIIIIITKNKLQLLRELQNPKILLGQI